jgi:hypothetical protein
LRREYGIMMNQARQNHPDDRGSPAKNENSHPRQRQRIRLGDLFAYAADSGIVCLLASRFCMSSSETNNYRISAPGPESSPG